MSSKPDHLWQRLWLRRDTNIQKRSQIGPDTDGFDAVPLSSLRDIPCLILLGSPGLGKSSELQLSAREAISYGETSDLIPLGRLSAVEGKRCFAGTFRMMC
jgi:hypothetical protein